MKKEKRLDSFDDFKVGDKVEFYIVDNTGRIRRKEALVAHEVSFVVTEKEHYSLAEVLSYISPDCPLGIKKLG